MGKQLLFLPAGTEGSPGHHPVGCPGLPWALVGPCCRIRPGGVVGLLVAKHKCSLHQCLLLTSEILWLYSSEGTKAAPWNSRILQVKHEIEIYFFF